MVIDDVRVHFGKYNNERLTDSKENHDLLESFSAPYAAEKMEEYLKQFAWEDDLAGKTKVYLVKDEDGRIVLYYSLRCGLVIDDSSYEILSKDKKDYVDWMTKSIKDKDSDQMALSYETCAKDCGYPEADKLFEISHRRADRKNDKEELSKLENTLYVERSYAAIELQHFCRNANYPSSRIHGVPIGFGIFWEQIVPQIKKIADLIGCEYLYLFAADKAQGEEPKKLVEHYKSAMKFSAVEDVKIVKPDYDMSCISLVQPLLGLEGNRRRAWEEYSDLIK